MEILDISRDQLGIGTRHRIQASTVLIVPIASKVGELLSRRQLKKQPPTKPTRLRAVCFSMRSEILWRAGAGDAEFLRFINSREGQESLHAAGVYPLSSQQSPSNLQALVETRFPLRA